MMADGVLQAIAVAGLVPSVFERSLRDQLFGAAHVLVGMALVFAGAGVPERRRVGVTALLVSFAIALLETTWFNWTGTVVRALYTAVVVYVLMRKTTLPTT